MLPLDAYVARLKLPSASGMILKVTISDYYQQMVHLEGRGQAKDHLVRTSIHDSVLICLTFKWQHNRHAFKTATKEEDRLLRTSVMKTLEGPSF